MKRIFLFLIVLFCESGLVCSQNKTEAVEMQPKVLAIFPSSDTLSANLLRVYIHFSKPMKPFGNLEKIQLVDARGIEIEGAIFNNVHELWNHEQTQLTLLFDPSRVKTGLRSHELRGRALESGNRYALEIGKLEDVEGRVTAPFRKYFVVTSSDTGPPNKNLWKIQPPKADSRDPLIIKFPQMLDHLSVLQRLKLTDMNSEPVAGQVHLVSKETEWQFYPKDTWQARQYLLYVHYRLEDPSGNNLNGLFDHSPGTLKYEREGVIETITIKLTK